MTPTRKPRTTRPTRDEDQEIDRIIGESGWAVSLAPAENPKLSGLYFAYTIGRSLKGKTELCTWGPYGQELVDLVNLVAVLADAQGNTLEEPHTLTLGRAGYLVAPVPGDMLPYLTQAHRRYTFLRAVSVTRAM